MTSQRANVLDAENEQLRSRLIAPWRALPLARPLNPFSGRAWTLSGEAQRVGDRERLRSVRSAGELDTLARPFYATRPSFIKKMPWREPDPWFQRWLDIDGLMQRLFAKGMPTILHVALKAFGRGLGRDDLESRLPDLVRATECIVAVPRRQGAKTFVERAMQLSPDLTTDWFVGGADVEERLLALYQHRSNCVHGKIPFLELHAKGDEGDEQAARFEYLAEYIAREAVLAALRAEGKHHEFDDRATLEDAWARGRFP
jgi:hypothetical protein